MMWAESYRWTENFAYFGFIPWTLQMWKNPSEQGHQIEGFWISLVVMRHTFLRKHFKLLYEHWISEAVKAFASNRASERVRDALQQLSGEADSCERHTWKLHQERCAFNKPFWALLSRLHVVDYDISVWKTSQIKAIKHKNQTCRECSASERWRACVCSLHLCGRGSYGGDCKPHSISLWILNIHASAHALYVHPCTPQHGQNALKIYDLNIPAGSSNLSSPAHSGFNYTADCRKRLF